MLSITSVLLICICKYAMSLPCLTNESEKDFDDSRKALSALETYLGSTVNTLESDIQKTLNTLKSHLGTLKSNVGSKVKRLDGDLKVLEEDFRKKKWLKHNGHCYYYAHEKHDWFTAERRCREIGGYIVKVDNSSENTWISDNKPKKNKYYWIGLTDLKEGDWRWTFDQSQATYKSWQSGTGARGTSNNCAVYNYGGYFRLWFDQTCMAKYYSICESNFCF
ncbi:lithostathine-1-beta-like [Mytilus galloprovincialis]|uniref:lithostathine-1-beta-like n=1 Tax=Mytilus galloprovincialis TaxID=29158 RepID=UPI003F7BCE74